MKHLKTFESHISDWDEDHWGLYDGWMETNEYLEKLFMDEI